MFTFRATAKLLARMKVKPSPFREEASTRLGDWYANVLFARPRPLVLCVSTRTLLPVLVHARDPETLLPRLRAGLREVLTALDVPSASIDAEDLEMRACCVDKTEDRRILGSMNDFHRLLEFQLEDDPGASLAAHALELARAPCGPIGMESPDRLTRALFAV